MEWELFRVWLRKFVWHVKAGEGEKFPATAAN